MIAVDNFTDDDDDDEYSDLFSDDGIAEMVKLLFILSVEDVSLFWRLMSVDELLDNKYL